MSSQASSAPAPRPEARGLALRLPPWLLTALLAGAWLAANPPTPDLAAHEYRAEVARRTGNLIWEQGWYAGHHLPGYSVLMPPLAALLGPQLVAALCAVAATWCFTALARGHWRPGAAQAASLWFALGAASTLLGGQLAFAAGLAPGLAALLLARRGPAWAAVLLGALTTLTSPVAAAFLVLACAAWWISAPRSRAPLGPAAGAVVPGLLLLVAFPGGGTQPFGTTSFLWSLGVALALLVALPRDERALRAGAALYAAALVGALALDTPLGSNMVRLAAVFGGPVAAGALWGRRDLALALLALPLLYVQWLAPVRSVERGAGDPSAHGAYHAPLVAELDRRARLEGPSRVEIPFTRTHWETRYVAPEHPLARGWERQLDVRRNPLFYDGALTPARYRRWLSELGVRYVAVPDVPFDAAGAGEARLVTSGAVPGLREVWHDPHWRLYAVAGARPPATPPLRVTALGLDRVDLTTPRPASGTVLVRFSPYWTLTRGRGCVSRAPGGWTALRLEAAGPARLEIRFAVGRIGASGQRCSG